MSNEHDRERDQATEAAMSRGALLRRGAFAGIAGASIAGGLIAPVSEAEVKTEQATTALRFLTAWEHDYLTAMAETGNP